MLSTPFPLPPPKPTLYTHTHSLPPRFLLRLMDSNAAAALPCVIQALPALAHDDASPTSRSQTPPKAKSKCRPQPTPKPSPPTPTSSRAPAPPSPRRTRSREAPEWTTVEMLALVNEVATVDEGWARSVSSYQKWRIVADNLAAAFCGGAGRRRRGRSASQCKRRWEALAGEYGAIRRWEMKGGGPRGGVGLYWKVDAAVRRRAGLPAAFDVEVYDAMGAVIQVEVPLGGGGLEEDGLVGGGEEEGGEEMEVDGGDFGCDKETKNEPQRSPSSAWELANKLQENAQHIQTVLKEVAEEDAGQNHTLVDSTSSPDATETARRKADELIKSLGGLVSTLNQFTELIKENGFENVISMN